MRLAEVAGCMNAVGDLGDRSQSWIDRVRTDSRCVEPGDLFVCIPGERFDGHNFAGQASDRGAAAVVSQQPFLSGVGETPVLLVHDTLVALADLGAAWRDRFQGTVVGVTASAGKTTVKELLGAALGEAGPTAKNFKNWNNHIGLPLSILACSGEEAFWVMEAGISRKGDMDELARILSPDVAVIGNVGSAHLEGLGDRRGVAREKCKLLMALRPEGRAVICQDYPLLVDEASKTGKPLVTFSTRDASAGCHAHYLGPGTGDQGRFMFQIQGERVETELPWQGEFMAENILAAVCVCHDLGLDLERVLRGVAGAVLPEHRFHCLSAGGWKLIDDCYNANPLSMLSSIRCAAQQAGSDPLVLVLGEMGELGAHAASEHRELGKCIAGIGCRAVFFKGGYREELEQGLKEGGWPGAVRSVADVLDLVEGFKELQLSRGLVLVKGSRACGLERFVWELTQELGS